MEIITLAIVIWLFWRWRKARRVKLNSVLGRLAGQERIGGFAVLDFETTGLSPAQGDRVVQVAVVHLSQDGWYQGHWSTLVNPGRDVGPTYIHGISNFEVLKAPNFAEVLPELLSKLEGRIIVAHNARFDLNFLFWEAQFAGQPLSLERRKFFDTMSIAREIFPHAIDKKMETLVALAGVKTSKLPGRGFHDALFDVYAEAELLKYYMSKDPSKVSQGIREVRDLKLTEIDERRLKALREFHESEKTSMNLLASILEKEVVDLSFDSEGEVLFLGRDNEERLEFERWSSGFGVKAGERLTKSKTKLLVVGSGDFNRKPLITAHNWGVPIVSIKHLRGSSLK
jgi:DNA polymerase III epsilon subunit-like protein